MVPVDPGVVRVEAFVSIFNHHVVRVVDEVVVIAGSANHVVGPVTAVEHVVASAAVELVVAAVDQHVVAFHAVHQVGLIVPVELVAMPRADQVLDIGEDIALGVAARIPADQQEGIERDTHALVRVVVGRPIDAVAAIEPVGAGAAIEEIVVVFAVELVVAGAAEQDVVVVTAEQVVVVLAALEPIVADAAVELVSAVLAEEVVVAAKAVNRVVPIPSINVVVAEGDAVGGIEKVRVRRSRDVGHGPSLSLPRLFGTTWIAGARRLTPTQPCCRSQLDSGGDFHRCPLVARQGPAVPALRVHT